MDEFLGGLVGFAVVVGAIIWAVGMVVKGLIWVVGMILTGVAWTFLALSAVFGHPVVLLLMLGAVGAAVGMVRFRLKHGPTVALGHDDYAELGPFRMVPEQWASLVLATFMVLVGLFGHLIV